MAISYNGYDSYYSYNSYFSYYSGVERLIVARLPSRGARAERRRARLRSLSVGGSGMVSILRSSSISNIGLSTVTSHLIGLG